jgi:hypothetical protein
MRASPGQIAVVGGDAYTWQPSSKVETLPGLGRMEEPGPLRLGRGALEGACIADRMSKEGLALQVWID